MDPHVIVNLMFMVGGLGLVWIIYEAWFSRGVSARKIEKKLKDNKHISVYDKEKNRRDRK